MWEYVVLDSSKVRQVALGSGSVVRLGSGGDDSPVRVARVFIDASAIYVLDESASPIRRYDRAGNAIFSLGSTSEPPAQLRSSQGIVARNDSLWVLSMRSEEGVAIVDGDGTVIARRDLPQSSSLGEISLSPTGIVVSSLFTRGRIREGSAHAAMSLDSDGLVIGRGCESDPVYTESARGGGFFALLGSTGVSVVDSLIFCRQAVSPIIQVLKLDGTPFAAIRIAPPFYRRGADAPQSLNQLDANRFAASLTEHYRLFAFRDGFLSVYTQFDLARNEREYPLFLCFRWQTAEPECLMSSTSERPVALLPPDTLVTEAVDGGSIPSLRLVPIR